MYIIDKINALLAEHGKTGSDLTRALGLSNGVYSQWNTKTTQPSRRNLKRIADYFGVPVSYFTDESNPIERTTPHEGENNSHAPLAEDVAYWAERLSRLTPSDQALLGSVAARLQESPEATRAALGLLLTAVQSSPHR